MVERQYDLMRRERMKQLEEPTAIKQPVENEAPPAPSQPNNATSSAPPGDVHPPQEVFNIFIIDSYQIDHIILC